MAKANYATIPRGLLSNARYRRLSFEASAALDRLHVACDSWGRFPADPIVIGPRTGYLTLDWPAVLAELAHFVDVYEVNGDLLGQIRGFDDHLTARMIANRGESEFHGPSDVSPVSGTDRTATGQSPAGDSTATGHQVADPCVRARSEPSRAEPEPSLSPDVYDTHAGARALDTALTRGIAAGKALAATPEPDPLPADLEALAVALLDRVATLRHKHGRFAEVGKDLAGTRLLVEVSAGSDVRAMAREYPDACRELVPRALEQGDKFRLGKGLARPNCLSYLRAAVIGWTAGESTNGRAVAPPVGPPRGGYMVPEWGESDA